MCPLRSKGGSHRAARRPPRTPLRETGKIPPKYLLTYLLVNKKESRFLNKHVGIIGMIGISAPPLFRLSRPPSGGGRGGVVGPLQGVGFGAKSNRGGDHFEQEAWPVCATITHRFECQGPTARAAQRVGRQTVTHGLSKIKWRKSRKGRRSATRQRCAEED